MMIYEAQTEVTLKPSSSFSGDAEPIAKSVLGNLSPSFAQIPIEMTRFHPRNSAKQLYCTLTVFQ